MIDFKAGDLLTIFWRGRLSLAPIFKNGGIRVGCLGLAVVCCLNTFDEMQRSTRMERELNILTQEPPPGISCWTVDDQIDKLEAGWLETTAFCKTTTTRGLHYLRGDVLHCNVCD